MSEVIWKTVTLYPGYSVSNTGEIKNNTTNRILKFYVRNGYKSVTLSKNNIKKTFNIHNIVADTFLEKPTDKKIVVNHKNENKLDNNLNNLEFVSYRENTIYSMTSVRTKNLSSFNLEEFVEIPNYNNYMVSRNGEIYSKSIKRLCCVNILPNGYKKIKLKSNDKKYKDIYVHVIVAMAYLGYVPIDNKLVINHINGKKGDNRLDNLEIITQKQNMIHSVKLNNHKIFRKSVYYVDDYGHKHVYNSAKEASDKTGIDNSSILKSCKSINKKAGDIKWYYTLNS